ncbi:MAG: hypothetical protein WC683_02475 [bacterium]
MARGRIFRITKAQAKAYEILDPPSTRSARPNPGVTAIMGITNGRGAAKRGARKGKARKSVRMLGGISCPKTAPKKHRMAGATKRSDYALPQCFHYPVRTRGKASVLKIRRALTRYGTHKSRYSPAVRRQIERGIAKAAKEAGMTSPVAMKYRKKFALANAKGESPMFVVPNAARKRARRKSKSRKLSPAHAFFLYPTTKGKIGASASPNRKRKARKARKGARKLKFGSPAWQKKFNPLYGGKGKTRKGKKSTAKRRTARRMVTSGVRRVTVRRGKGKRRSGLSVALRNMSILPAVPNKRRRSTKKYSAAWHRKMTHAVANRYRRRARRNAEGEGIFFPGEGGGSFMDEPSTIMSEAQEKKLAAAATAEGIAQDMFKTQADFDAWFANMYKSKTFRKFYMSFRRRRTALSKRGRKMATRKKGKKAAGRKPRKGKKARKARKGTRKLKFGSPAWRKKYARKIAAGRRKAKRHGTRKAAKRRKSGSRSKRRVTRRRGTARRRSAARRRTGGRRLKFGSKAYNKKYAAKRKRNLRSAKRHGKRRARRNFSFRAIPNQLLMRVKAMAIPGLIALGGYAIHRVVTKVLSKAIGGTVTSYAEPLSGLVAIAAGTWAVGKFLPQHSHAAIMGMAVSFGALLLKSFLPDVATYLGMGSVGSQNQRVRWGMQGPEFMQAAAGPEFMQAAAGPGFLQAAADYYQPASGIGEYVSDGSLSPVSDFGEYVASNLDVSGWGDYEVSTQYQTGADGYGAINDGIQPGGNLDQQFNIMEAAAGLGLNSPGSSSTYVPHEGMRNVASAESSDSSGVFDVGGGNGVLG